MNTLFTLNAGAESQHERITSTLPLADLIAAYLHDVDYNNPHTAKNKRQGLRIFQQLDIPLDDHCLKRFDMHLSQQYKPATRMGYVTALRCMLTWLHANDLLPAHINITKCVHILNTHRGSRRNAFRYHPPQPHPRIAELRNVYDGIALSQHQPHLRRKLLCNRAVMHVLFSTACRRDEISRLTREQVAHGHAGEVIVTGKGNVDRVVMLDRTTQLAIQAYLAERIDKSPALFVSETRNHFESLGGQGIYYIVKAAARIANIKGKSSPHMIRHFVACDMLEHGVPLEIIQMYLGHANINTTRDVYAHSTKGAMRRHVRTYMNNAGQLPLIEIV